MKKNSIAAIYEKARTGGWVDNQDLTYLVRQALKKAFPKTKFSVRNRSYSSIDIKWTDGPTVAQVQEVSSGYETKSFDGSIDLAYSKGFWLYSDGSCSHAVCEGTEGSNGYVSESVGSSLRPDGVLVTNVSGCYVFEHRDNSPEFLREVVEVVKSQYGAEYAAELSVYECKGHEQIGYINCKNFEKYRLANELASQTAK